MTRLLRPRRTLKHRVIDVMLRQQRLLIAARIAEAIERAAPCPPADHCADRFCPDCIRHAQAKADALIARRTGQAEEARDGVAARAPGADYRPHGGK